MPLDGLSFSNSGMFRIVTPMEVAAQAEQQAQVQAETSIKKTEEKEKIKPDIEDDSEDPKRDFQNREDDESGSDDESNFNEDNLKKYRVKFNQITDMVEFIDFKTGLVIETISPNDLINLISKSKGTSGILVDKEI